MFAVARPDTRQDTLPAAARTIRAMCATVPPQTIPAAGSPGGPPLPDAYRFFGGFPGIDVRPMFVNCIRDPQQLQPTLDRIQAMFVATQKKK